MLRRRRTRSHRETTSERLGRRLRELGMTQVELGERLGVSSGAISRWISGERRPTLDFAFGIQRVLGIPAEAWREAG